MWNRILDKLLTRTIVTGALELTLADGTVRRYGHAGTDPVRVRLFDHAFARKVLLSPDMTLGEAYMNGTVQIEGDDLRALLGTILANRRAGHGHWALTLNARLRRALRWMQQYNPIGRARSNISHHYDLSAELYDLFLDRDRQYSCAYFRHPGDTLDKAQAQKKAHIAEKLLIEPGMSVLDIGCGWGGMALTLARDYGARVVGVTLSEEQHKIATDRVRKAGLQGQVDIRLTDYRTVTETFDRIVSVGMFEHVGVPHYREYFSHVRDKLTEDGVALIHTIGRADPPGTTSPWVLKYIFPGGYTPAMSEVMRAVEKEQLVVTDVEVWRNHYAETLRHWYARFVANEDRARQLYDERFCRMWRYYLIASEMTFRARDQVVFQFQLSRDQLAVPVTREYLYTTPSEQDVRTAAR